MRFELTRMKKGKWREVYSIKRNNIKEACTEFRKFLATEDNPEKYLVRVIRPKAEYYDLDGNEVNQYDDRQKMEQVLMNLNIDYTIWNWGDGVEDIVTLNIGDEYIPDYKCLSIIFRDGHFDSFNVSDGKD